MMKSVRNCLLLVSLYSLSQVAMAAEPGFYIGAGVGAYTLEIDDTDFDDNATTLRALVGLQLTENFAIEADYQKLFDVEDDTLGIDTELNADVWSVALRPILPVTDFIDLYAKVGYSWYDVDAETAIAGIPITADDSDGAFNWGGGVDVNLGSVSLRGELSRIEVDDAELNLVTASVIVRF